MERLDNKYLSDLVQKAAAGSSNALAELFSASSARVYTYLTYFEGEDTLNALENVFVRIFKELKTLKTPSLYMPWCCRICFLYMTEQRENPQDAAGRTYGGYDERQLLSLPLAESQIMIMRHAQHMSNKEIADILNADRSSVRRIIGSAEKHLERTGNEVSQETAGTSQARRTKTAKLDKKQAEAMLKRVFKECGKKPNSIPVEALSAYAVYRKERFSIQRGILIAAIIVFMLLPLCFILPAYTVSSVDKGERGLPVYTVSLNGIIPVRAVTARIGGHSLPVYEATSREFSVEPTRNGELTIQVELINTQSVTTEYSVTAADSEAPDLISSSVSDGKVYLNVEDEGIGVDFREIFAADENGEDHYPISYDTDTGEVVFEYPESAWDVYIPDHIGNTLHLAFTFE